VAGDGNFFTVSVVAGADMGAKAASDTAVIQGWSGEGEDGEGAGSQPAMLPR
jgi:hypothetical protein